MRGDVAQAQRSRESLQALDGTDFTVVANLENETEQLSYLRLMNLNTYAVSVTVNLVGTLTGRNYGVLQLEIPSYASKQFSYGDIWSRAGSPQPSGEYAEGGSGPFTYYIQSSAEHTYFQHVTHSSSTGFFENKSTCLWPDNGRYSELNSFVANVHTSSAYMVDYPSFVMMHHYGSSSATYRAQVRRGSDGQVMDSFTFEMAPNESYTAGWDWFELNWRPVPEESHANIVFSRADGGAYQMLLGHFVYNDRLGADLNMSQFCPVAASTAQSPATYTLMTATSGTGSGSISVTPPGELQTSGGRVFTSGASVTLTASAATGSVFAGWSGACTGTATTCTVAMTADRTVTGTFNRTAGTTLNYLVVASTRPASCTSTSPPSASTFQSTDDQVEGVANLHAATAGSAVVFEWYKPDGSLYLRNQKTTPADGNYCYYDTMYIEGYTPSITPGTWSVRILYNGTVFARRTFAISTSGQGGSGQGQCSGFYDGANACGRCSSDADCGGGNHCYTTALPAPFCSALPADAPDNARQSMRSRPPVDAAKVKTWMQRVWERQRQQDTASTASQPWGGATARDSLREGVAGSFPR